MQDLSNRKQRPVLIISNDDYNSNTEDVIVAAITSQLKNTDYSVIIEQKDLEEGLIKVKSAVRTDKIYTLSKGIIRKKFGKVRPEVLQYVRNNINELIQ
ncbi:type II toxin-antitoxin system PemK/MazF family toxin [Salisediminibacterium selenitireducens]|uniref:type II toxin-antitoxin system PemK/MazF family toxin n=1 Tax=Salisediminibacterium selenitireducens TaxID=85683 RepID=UPI0038CDA834